MKTLLTPSPAVKDVLLRGLAYLLWLVNIGVCTLALLQLLSTVNVFWVVLGGDRYSLALVNQVCLLLGGFVVFVYVMCLESHYRESVTRRVETSIINDDAAGKASSQLPTRVGQQLTDLGLGILLQRFAITTALPIGVWLASLAALEVALQMLN